MPARAARDPLPLYAIRAAAIRETAYQCLSWLHVSWRISDLERQIDPPHRFIAISSIRNCQSLDKVKNCEATISHKLSCTALLFFLRLSPMTRLSHRRILSLPAVRACEAILPTTLLASLVALLRDVLSCRHCEFPTHQSIIREALREADVLLFFLEDVRDRGSALPPSALLSLCELHVTLQKLRHLLAGCARRDARLWILMRSERVACEFRILIRTIATALDVLPLEEIDSSEEAKELVRMVARQAWRVAIAADTEDNQAMRGVRSILGQLESGVSPAPEDLRSVLDRLGIRSWAECNEEISFLEEEFFEHSDEEGGEAAFLSSLMGFMAYCRAVLFFGDAAHAKRSERTNSKSQGLSLDHINPKDFCCPISLELMMDPVTVSTGQTYDRASILRWLRTGCHTCPATGEKLWNTELVPNSTMQKLVHQLCQDNNIRITEPSRHQKHDLSKTTSAGSRAAEGAMRLAVPFVVKKISIGTKEERSKAAHEIRMLSKSSLFNRAYLVETGSVPYLLTLLSSPDPSTQEHSVAALLNISKHPKGREAIFKAGGLRPILDVLIKGHKVEAQQNAAAIFFYLSSVEEYQKEIGRIPKAIPAIVDLLRRGTYRGKKNAVVTLFGLLLYHGNHSEVLAAKAVPVLTELLSAEREDLVNDSVAVLAKLAERPEGTKAILSSSSVPLLAEVLRSTASRSSKEYCVSVLLSLCNHGGSKVVNLLEEIPSLMPTLYSLLTEGSSQASKKARSLLGYIHHFYDLDRPVFLTPPVRDPVLHAQ